MIEPNEYLTKEEFYSDWLFDNEHWLRKAYIEELGHDGTFDENDFDAFCRQEYKDRRD